MTGRLPGRGVFAFFAAILLLAALPSGARAQAPPAGTVISSTSVAYYDAGDGRSSVNSNTIRFNVLPVYGPLVLPDGTTDAPAAVSSAFSGEAVVFGYSLTNTGNAPDTFALRVLTVAPSQFVPSSVIYLDEDGDGEVDPGEHTITEAGPVAQGETVRLVLSSVLPAGLLGGETAHLDLEARSQGDTSLVDRGNIVRIVARSAARVDLTLSSDVSDVQPGGEVAWTILFENTGELTSSDVVVTDFIDFGGMMDGTEFVPGSAVSSLPGVIEYYDIDRALWTDVAPPSARVKGARLRLADLAPGGAGTLSFRVRVDADHGWGDIRDEAIADWTGADAQPYQSVSNEVVVTVGRLSAVRMGPAGDPGAPSGTAEDRVLVMLSASDTSCTFLHEVRNDGNFADTFHVALADSALIPADWSVSFTDSAGTPLPVRSSYTARLGPIERGGSRRVRLRIEAPAERLRDFDGRELSFDAEAYSLYDPGARDAVGNVLIKDDTPLLSITQSIREPNAMVGDILSFIVAVENLTAETRVDSIEVLERLPSGLAFADGDRPVSTGRNAIRWAIGSLEPGTRREIVLRARVTAGQERDELVAAAYVDGITSYGERASGGPAYASVRLVEGEFTRRGIIFGSVFVDDDGDGLRGNRERGVPGARVFYEKGTYAVSDSAGLWSIPGVDEGTHVVRIDPKSLPDSLMPGPAGHFGMGVPGQYLIDLAPSGDRRVEFPLRRRISPAGDSVFAALEDDSTAVTRSGRDGAEAPERQGGDSAGTEAAAVPDEEASTKNESGTFEALILPSTLFAAGSCDLEDIPLREVAALSLWLREHPGWTISIEGHSDNTPISTAEYPSNFELSVARARTVFQVLRMNGIPAERMDFTGYGDRKPIADNATETGRARNRRVEVRAVPPDGYDGADPMIPAVLAAPDTTGPRRYQLADSAGICADIVKPDEGRIFTDRDGIDVEILSPLASDLELYVNNVPVGREKIGRKQIDIPNNTIGYIFYGVKIAPGLNNILVVCRTAGERNVCVRHVYLAGPPTVLVAERDPVEAPADGAARPEITFLVSDESGLPVRDGLFVTVTGPDDLLAGADVNPQMNGVQVTTHKGRAVVKLAPSPHSRRETVYAVLGKLQAGCSLEYVSPMRDWFLLGYGEGDIGYSSLSGSGDTRRSYERQPDGLYAEGKVALYGQGEIRSGHLLTVAVDTRPVVEDKLLDRIEPEKYYPLYGDASDLQFNASSRSGTYLSLDHRDYSALIGDYKTELSGLEFTRYDRTLTGLRAEGRRGRFAAATFLAYTDQVTFQEEIPAAGTSGFYFLSHYPLLENSEKIRVEVRDRYRPEVILRADDKNWGRDYDINYMDGSILFKEPVPAFDQDLNPVTIVVSYECRLAGEKNFTYGIRPTVALNDSLTLGVTAVLEDEGDGNSSLVGVDLAGHLWKDLSIESEFAHSDKFALGAGDAFRLRLIGRHDGLATWSAYYRDIDEDFFNPSFSGGKTELGSRKYGLDADLRLTPSWHVSTKAYSHSFAERDERKGYADIQARYEDGPLSAKAGLASASHSDTREGDHSSVLALAGAGFEKWKFKGDVEVDQIIAGEEVQEYPDRIQANLKRQIWKWIDGRLTYEYRTGRRTGTRHLLQLGVESSLSEDLQVYSRYRMEGAMSGERGQATIGLKNRFRLAPGLTSTFSIESLATVSGFALDDFTSIVTEWMFTPPGRDYKIKGQYELRLETERRVHLAGAAGLKRLGPQWSGLAKGDLWYADEKTRSDQIKASGDLGLSVRPAAGRLMLLGMLKGRYERNSPAHPGAVDRAITVMTEADYSIDDRWSLEGKVAGRWVASAFKAYTTSSSTFLYQAQVVRAVGERWDVSAAARLVQQVETHTLRYGGGIEVGRLMAENVQAVAGYDFGGHRDADTELNEFTRNGFHIGIRLKFDERLLEYFNALR